MSSSASGPTDLADEDRSSVAAGFVFAGDDLGGLTVECRSCRRPVIVVQAGLNAVAVERAMKDHVWDGQCPADHRFPLPPPPWRDGIDTTVDPPQWQRTLDALDRHWTP